MTNDLIILQTELERSVEEAKLEGKTLIEKALNKLGVIQFVRRKN